MSVEMVKAKFTCQSVTEYTYNKAVELTAVYSQTGENADFCRATPNGQIKMTIDKNVPASDFFIPGKEYYLLFEKATQENQELR